MPRFGDLEAAVMAEVWSAGRPVRVRDVLSRINRRKQLAYTTVQTVMEVLHRKGWLSRSKDGRANLYTATASREDYIAGLMGEALTETDDRAAALLRFFERMDAGQARELRRAWDQAKISGHGR
ncbi:MAG: BlaI/MecI/CopY family transcriptional regulator [Actinobacteria bacterium]|nr:BlaI/MecI/CopY family transcriptional regulator [Actinomycetota bacterium]